MHQVREHISKGDNYHILIRAKAKIGYENVFRVVYDQLGIKVAYVMNCHSILALKAFETRQTKYYMVVRINCEWLLLNKTCFHLEINGESFFLSQTCQQM